MTLPDIVGMGLGRTLPGTTWEHHLTVTLPRLCEAVSSALLNGSFCRVRAVVNRSVPKGWRCSDPEGDTARYVAGLGLEPSTTVGLITAVSVADLRYATASLSGWRVHTLVTAGVRNAAAAGGRFPLNETPCRHGQPDYPRRRVAAPGGSRQRRRNYDPGHNRRRVAGVTTRFGEAATGTTTDTVTVVNLGKGPTSPYAGFATVPAA